MQFIGNVERIKFTIFMFHYNTSELELNAEAAGYLELIASARFHVFIYLLDFTVSGTGGVS